MPPTFAPPFDAGAARTAPRSRRRRSRRAVGAGWLAASVLLHACVLGAVWPQGARQATPLPSPVHLRLLIGAPAVESVTDAAAAFVESDVPDVPALGTVAVAVAAADGPSAGPSDAPSVAPSHARALRRLPGSSRHGIPVTTDVRSGPTAGDMVAIPLQVAAVTAPATAAPAQDLSMSARTGEDDAPAASADTPASDRPMATAVGEFSAPTYRTAPPPAMRLSYELRHGMLSGQGVIDWHPSGGQYELRLEGRIASLTLLTQVSTGGFDAHGLAPVRYTDQRMKRATNAANLQRATGRITFSGPTNEYALLPGTQDRVSWMVQLAAIVDAEPTLAKPGAEITLFVVGARGEGDIWVFRCVGDESVDTGLGPMPAIKFIREPAKPHDTQVEAWLAPKLHGLPAHARLSNGSDGALDLVLREVQ